MFRAYKSVMVARILLSACGEGTEKKKGLEAIDQSAQQTNTENLSDGSELFSKYGCFACHSLDGLIMYGPPLNDLFMQEISVLREGKEMKIIADREYLIKAITDPDYEKVSEYKRRIMPEPVIPADDIETLVDYLIKLGDEE